VSVKLPGVYVHQVGDLIEGQPIFNALRHCVVGDVGDGVVGGEHYLGV